MIKKMAIIVLLQIGNLITSMSEAAISHREIIVPLDGMVPDQNLTAFSMIAIIFKSMYHRSPYKQKRCFVITSENGQRYPYLSNTMDVGTLSCHSTSA